MASRQTPPSASKIPRWKTPPSSPRNRTASFLHGASPNSPTTPTSRVQFSKTKSASSSPRQPISFRGLGSYPRPNLNLNSGSPSIKSKSDGEKIQGGSVPTASQSPIMTAPKESIAAHMGQGEGATIPDHEASKIEKHILSKNEMNNTSGTSASTVGVTNLEHGSSPLKTPSQAVNCAGSKSKDVNILYAANSIQAESTTSIHSPYHRKSPTYLDMYKQHKEYETQALQGSDSMISLRSSRKDTMLKDGNETGSSKTVSSSQDEGSICKKNDSLEWDFTSHQCKEFSTQTTTSMVGAGDSDKAERDELFTQTSSSMLGVVDKISREELFTQTTPSMMDAVNKVSVEELFTQTTPSLIETQENMLMEDFCTQTTASLVSAVDRASSCIPLESFSTESLLDNQTKPVLVIDQTTEHEESEASCDEDVLFSREIQVESQHTPEEEMEQRDFDYLESLCEGLEFIDEDDQFEESYSQYPREYEGEVDTILMAEVPVTISESFSLESQKKVDTIPTAEIPVTISESFSLESRKESCAFIQENKTDSSPTDGISAQRTQSSPGTKSKKSQHEVRETGDNAETENFVFKKLEKPSSRASAPSLQEWQTEKLIPRLNFSPDGRAIEIQPSPAPLTPDELNASWIPQRDLKYELPAVALSTRSSLILAQSDKSQRTLKSSFEVSNSTSFLHGYRIMVNSAAQRHLQINPTMGLISPHGQVTINITSDATRQCQEKIADFRIVVKMFRAHCDDPTKLREYYYTLEEQHPELIQSQTIKKVVLWNPDDLAEMLDMINIIPDEEERESLKLDLHRRISTSMQEDSKLSTVEQLQALRRGWIMANENLRNLYEEMGFIRNNVLFVGFVLLCIFAICFIMPLTMERTLFGGQPTTEPELGFFQKFMDNIKEYADNMKNAIAKYF